MRVVTVRADVLWLGLAGALATAALLGAWIFELGLGYLPCKLCLWQRWPYYIGLPLALLGLFMAWSGADRRVVLVLGGLFALVMLAGAALGVYHAGAEWKFWPGPTDCGGRIGAMPGSVDDFRKSLTTARVVRCDEAALRVLGLSFPGWNVLVSVACVAATMLGLRRIP